MSEYLPVLVSLVALSIAVASARSAHRDMKESEAAADRAEAALREMRNR